MRTISRLLRYVIPAAVMLPMFLVGQSEPKSGFVRLANALAVGTGMLTMEIDGKSVNAKGYKTGNVTGGISLAPGNRTVKFSRPGIKDGTTRVKVVPDETTILVPFAERVPATDEEPAHWVIRVLRLKQQDPEEARGGTFISVSRKPEIRVDMRDPSGQWNPVFVKRLAVTRTPILYPRGYVPLKTTDSDLASIPVASKGNYVVLLYDGEDGEIRSLNFRDRKFLSAD